MFLHGLAPARPTRRGKSPLARRRQFVAAIALSALACAACGTTAPFQGQQAGGTINGGYTQTGSGSGLSGTGTSGNTGFSAANQQAASGQGQDTSLGGGQDAAQPNADGGGDTSVANGAVSTGAPSADGGGEPASAPGGQSSVNTAPGTVTSTGGAGTAPVNGGSNPTGSSAQASANGGGKTTTTTPGKSAPTTTTKTGAKPTAAATTQPGTKTGTQTGTGSGGGGSTTGPTTAASDIPATGPGWDANTIYIGGATETDTQAAGSTLGVGAFDFGDQVAEGKAILDHVNAIGSEFGRKISQVTYDVSTTTDPAQEAAEACQLWTQDHRVALVLLNIGRLNTLEMYNCLAQAHIPMIVFGQSATAAGDMAQFAPYMIQPNNVYADRLGPFWVARLKAQGYFSGWNNAAGAPSTTAPVKVGIVYGATPQADHAWALIAQAIKAAGFGDVDVETYDPASVSGFSQIAVKLRSDGVTHVFLDTNAGLFYPSAAQSQNYFARYAVDTPDLIQPIVTGSNKAQLAGAMGIGWEPTIDVDQAHDPGALPGFAACIKVETDAGVDMSKRNYQFAATGGCDLYYFLVAGLNAGGGLDADSILAGLRKVAPTQQWTQQFGAGSNAGSNNDLTTMARDIKYDGGCSCFTYTGSNQQVP